MKNQHEEKHSNLDSLEGFKTLSESEEMEVLGGVSAKIGNCAPPLRWNGTRCCLDESMGTSQSKSSTTITPKPSGHSHLTTNLNSFGPQGKGVGQAPIQPAGVPNC